MAYIVMAYIVMAYGGIGVNVLDSSKIDDVALLCRVQPVQYLGHNYIGHNCCAGYQPMPTPTVCACRRAQVSGVWRRASVAGGASLHRMPLPAG